jgi:hypothetical protein
MCMFCAAVPAIATAGISINNKQKERERAAIARGETPRRPRLVAALATYLAIVAVLIASVAYHSRANV